ncbi:putative carbohydrate esterase [Vitis vinifera]|uniref:Putative carbohydrate esterase n=1 Tax=Vitis vinifera TaxID=29760 RepID=A0A438INM7_VITVI|nr:putative carbohydrate esterase [Vitis vinifera]
MSFANAVRKCMRWWVGTMHGGSTAIKEWAHGQPLYENMVNRAKESVKSGWEIKVLLWYQGESDTSLYNNAKLYKDNIESLIQNVRQDLAFSPNHPNKFDVPGNKQDGVSLMKRTTLERRGQDQKLIYRAMASHQTMSFAICHHYASVVEHVPKMSNTLTKSSTKSSFTSRQFKNVFHNCRKGKDDLVEDLVKVLDHFKVV